MSLKKVIFALIMTALIYLSLFPRAVETLNHNPVFEIDQGRDYMAVKSIVVDHKLTLIGAELGAGQAGLSYLFHGPGYFYLLTIPFILFNGNPAGGVVLMLLFGLSAIAFGIFFISRLLGKNYGLLMGFLIATSPYLVGQSRLIENHFPSPAFILLVFYFVFKAIKEPKESNKFLFFAALLSAGIYNLETAIAIPLTLNLILFSILYFRKKVFSKLPYILCGILIALMPALFFESRHGFMAIRSVISYITSHPDRHDKYANFAIHSKDIFNLVVFEFSDSFAGRLFAPSNLLNLLFFVFGGFSLVVTIKEKDRIKRSLLIYLLLLFPTNFIVFMLLRNIVFQHYITDLLLANLIFTIFILKWLFNTNKTSGYVFLAYFCVLFIVVGINSYKVSVDDYKDYGGVHKLKGKTDAIDYIYKDAVGKPFGLLTFAPSVYTYPYDYLVWWYGKRKFGYLPTSDKKGTFYLLIEPDPDKPWSYKGWEETIIKSGQVIFTKTLPSGLIVEKRLN